MSLRKATWPTVSSAPEPPTPRRHNPMALSSLVHPTTPRSQTMRYPTSQRPDHFEQPRDSHNARHEPYVYPATFTSYRPGMSKVEGYERYSLLGEGDYTSSNSSDSSPPHSHSSLSHNEHPYYHPRHFDSGPQAGPSNPRPSTATSSTLSSPIPRFKELLSNTTDEETKFKRQDVPPFAPIYHRSQAHRQENNRSFGAFKNGRHFCTFVRYATGHPCLSWEDGYTTWYDLARHADAEHGPEEVELMDQRRLDFESAQWVKTEEQRNAIKNTMLGMVCRACGTKFASNRFDSMDRHVRKGACERAQERQKNKHNSATIHKKKGGKTAAGHTRR